MERRRRHRLGVLVLWMGCALPQARAEEPLAWEEVPAAAGEAFDAAEGRGWRARADAARAAAHAEPHPLNSLFVQLEPDPRPGAVWAEGTQAALQVDVGAGYGARRRAWQAQGLALEAEGAHARRGFILDVQAAWLDAWKAAALAEHLAEHVAQLSQALAPIEDAVAEGVVAASVRDALRLELGKMRAEELAARAEAARAEVALSSLLGDEVVVGPDALGSLDADPTPDDNPWRALVDRVEELPSVQTLTRQAEASDAQARAARRGWQAQLGLGTSLRAGPDGAYAVPLVLLTVPLSNPDAPQARLAQAEALALRADRAWRVRQLEAELEAEARALTVAVARYRALGDEVVVPARERLERFLEALGQGSVSTVDVVLARRDAHEAFHAWVLAAVDVRTSLARARAMSAQIPGGVR